MGLIEYVCVRPDVGVGHAFTVPEPVDRCQGFICGEPCPYPVKRIGKGSRVTAT